METKRLKNTIFTLSTLLLILTLCIGIKAYSVVTDNEQSAINALNGKLVCAINDPYQIRYFKANVIKNLNRDVEVISLGSSHLLFLSKNAVKGDYINLSVGGADIQDRLNILGLLDICGVKYKKIIYEIDIASFLPNARETKVYNKNFKEYGDYFYNKVVLGNKVKKPELNFNDKYVNEFLDDENKEDKNLLLTYDEKSLPKRLVYYDSNCSQHFTKEVYESEKNRKSDAAEIIIQNDSLIKQAYINAESKIITDAVMKYFHDNGIEIVIVVIPRPPLIYTSSKVSGSSFLNSINDLIAKYSRDYNAKVYGSFSPYDMGFSDDDYYDALHLDYDVLNKSYAIS